MRNYVFIWALLLGMFGACVKPSTEEYISKGIEYFPYNVNSVRYYIVDSTVYNGVPGQQKKISFLLRETVTQEFMDNAGNNNVRIEQYASKDNDTSYDFFGLATANLDGYGVQWKENNTRFFILSFPIRNGREWNGNLYNKMGWQGYKYSSMEKLYDGRYFQFPNTVTVTRERNENLFFTNVFVEVYAKNIGLVYKERSEMEHQNLSNPDIIIGYKLEWHLQKYIP